MPSIGHTVRIVPAKFVNPPRPSHSVFRRAILTPEGEEIGTVTADGAYDTRRCHTAIIDREATAIIPIHKNGRPWKADCPAAIARNETLRVTRHYGRTFWKRWT